MVPAPAPHGPGSLVIWKNILGQIFSRSLSIIWMHAAPGEYIYAPGTACISKYDPGACLT